LDLAHFTYGPTTKLLFDHKPQLIATGCTSGASRLSGVIDWVAADWKDKSRKPKFTAICYEATTSRQSEDPNVFKHGKEKGVEVLPWAYYSFVATDFGTELRRVIEENKADYVWLRGGAAQVAAIMKDVVRLGYKDKAKWIITYFSLDPVVAKLAGNDVMEGVYGVNSDAGVPTDKGWGIDLVKKLFKKYRKKGELSKLYISGVHVAMIAHESVKRALEKVGDPKKLTGKGIIDQYYTIKDFDLGGVAPKTTINYPNPAMMSKIRMVQWQKDGQILPVTDWIDVPWVFGNPDFKD
jgi:hypothetical protein